MGKKEEPGRREWNAIVNSEAMRMQGMDVHLSLFFSFSPYLTAPAKGRTLIEEKGRTQICQGLGRHKEGERSSLHSSFQKKNGLVKGANAR